MLGITDVTADEGADDRIVIGAAKRLVFTGGGVIESGDEVVWISGGKVDNDCRVDSFLDGPKSTVDALLGANFLIPDANRTGTAGQTWKLCYRFG